MKVVATIGLLVVGLIVWAQTLQKGPLSRSAPVAPVYELIAKTEIKNGIRPYAETTYTLYEKTPAGRRERWRLMQGGKYKAHWISPGGMVWVVTEGMPGPGGAAMLFARDLWGNLRMGWTGNHTRRTDPRTKRTVDVSLDIDVAATVAVSLHNGSEQLRLIDKQGNEFRATIANTASGILQLGRVFAAGEPKIDLLTDLLNKPHGPAEYEWVDSGRIPVLIWTFHNENPNKHLIHAVGPQSGPIGSGTFALLTERQASRKPASVERTPSGKILWFEFANSWEPAMAKLDVLTGDLQLIKSIDLLALGKFQSSQEAWKSIIYRDVLSNAGGGFEPLNSPNRYAPPPHEILAFSDRSGRKYRVDIAHKGEKYDVTAVASMNLDKVAIKEPTYPDATQVSSSSSVSPEGHFTASYRVYDRDGKKQSQVTLIANLTDPIDGKRSIEIFSTPLPYQPEAIRVSDSGRVYAISFMKFPNATADSCYLQVWDATGKTMGIDLMRSTKWFSSIDEAKQSVDLSKVSFESDGLKVERMIEGVPVQSYPVEAVVFKVGGRTERIYVGFMNEHMPLMFYSRKPKL